MYFGRKITLLSMTFLFASTLLFAGDKGELRDLSKDNIAFAPNASSSIIAKPVKPIRTRGLTAEFLMYIPPKDSLIWKSWGFTVTMETGNDKYSVCLHPSQAVSPNRVFLFLLLNGQGDGDALDEVESGKWHHISLVVEETEARLYFDGKLWKHQAGPKEYPLNLQSLWMGKVKRDWCNVVMNFGGEEISLQNALYPDGVLIDDVRLWAKAMGRNELSEAYGRNLKKEKRLIAYLPFTRGRDDCLTKYMKTRSEGKVKFVESSIDIASVMEGFAKENSQAMTNAIKTRDEWVAGLEKTPVNAVLCNALAEWYLLQDDMDERDEKQGLAYAVKAIEYGGTNAYPHLNTLALAHYRNKNLDEAVQCQEKALEALRTDTEITDEQRIKLMPKYERCLELYRCCVKEK